MARQSLFIPPEIKQSINAHLTAKCTDALEGFASAQEEEDALTGDLGATLRIRNQKVLVQHQELDSAGTWIWEINYKKFRGRGNNATEHFLGADGIFELILHSHGTTQKKSVLFQTKKNWKNDQNVFVQALKMTTWREAAFVLNFTASAYETFDLDSVILARGKKPVVSQKPLASLLGGDFLDCRIGDTNLNYDGKAKLLSWRSLTGDTVATNFAIAHKLTLKIKAPDAASTEKMIANKDVFKYRMNTTAEEILSLPSGFTEDDLKKARREKAKVFHLDATGRHNTLVDELNTMRMQEINHAFDELKRTIKKD